MYLYLLKIYLSASDPAILGVIPSYKPRCEPDGERALWLLKEHANKLNTIKVRFYNIIFPGCCNRETGNFLNSEPATGNSLNYSVYVPSLPCKRLLQALQLLPQSTKVSDILLFLESVMAERASRKKHCQMLKSLLYAEHLQVLLMVVTVSGG